MMLFPWSLQPCLPKVAGIGRRFLYCIENNEATIYCSRPGAYPTLGIGDMEHQPLSHGNRSDVGYLVIISHFIAAGKITDAARQPAFMIVAAQKVLIFVG